jgi:hypothetical protein
VAAGAQDDGPTATHDRVIPAEVAPARRSASALAKARTQRLSDGTPVRSFRSLVAEVATLTKNTVRVPNSSASFDKLANPMPLQERALQLLTLRARL